MGIAMSRRASVRLLATVAAMCLASHAVPAKDRVRISLVLGATGTEFSGEQRAGANAAIRDLNRLNPGKNVALRVAGPAQIDPGQEVQIFLSEAATSPDVIVLAPIPPSLFTEPALRVQAQGIPLVYLMSPPSRGVDNALFVGQREYDMGRRVANLVADRIIAKSAGTAPADITGVIVPGLCVPGMENLEDRMLGVQAALKERLPKVQVLPNMNTGNERGNGFAVWQQAVQARANALAFIGACENDSTNIAKIKEDEKRNYEVVAFDTPEPVRNSLKVGSIAAAVPPSHFASAYLAVWTAGTALLNDRKVPTGWLSTYITTINAANMDGFNRASLPPTGLEAFYRLHIENLKKVDTSKLPPLSAARAPGRG